MEPIGIIKEMQADGCIIVELFPDQIEKTASVEPSDPSNVLKQRSAILRDNLELLELEKQRKNIEKKLEALRTVCPHPCVVIIHSAHNSNEAYNEWSCNETSQCFVCGLEENSLDHHRPAYKNLRSKPVCRFEWYNKHPRYNPMEHTMEENFEKIKQEGLCRGYK